MFISQSNFCRFAEVRGKMETVSGWLCTFKELSDMDGSDSLGLPGDLFGSMECYYVLASPNAESHPPGASFVLL